MNEMKCSCPQCLGCPEEGVKMPYEDGVIWERRAIHWKGEAEKAWSEVARLNGLLAAGKQDESVERVERDYRNKLQDELAAARKRIAILEERRGAHWAARWLCATLQNKVRSLKEERDKWKKECEELTVRNKEFIQELNAVSRTAGQLREGNVSLVSQLEVAYEERDKWKKECAELQRQVESLQETLKDLATNRNHWAEEFSVVRDEGRLLREQLRGAEAELADARKRIAVLEEISKAMERE